MPFWNRRGPARVLLVLAVLVAGLITGCASAPEPPTRLQLRLLAGPEVNPGPDGRAAPVVVRVYLLRNAGVFEGADFFSLYDRDQATLKDDLLGREEFQIAPGGTGRLDKEVSAEVRLLGVVAAFRDVDQAVWRAVQPLRGKQVNDLTVVLGRRTVSISPGAP
jgi:type VI secretion system protein VasD